MLIVDVALIVLLVVALFIGASRGLTGSLGMLIGLIAGGAAAYWLVPIVNDAWVWQEWRPLAIIVAIVLLLAIGAAIGGAIGSVARRGVDRTPLRIIDRLLGGVAGVVIAALVLSLAGTSLAATGTPVISSSVSSSWVLRSIERVTPAPIARALADLRGFVLDEGIPQLDDLLAVIDPPSIAPFDLDDPALAGAAASVARVSGTAYSCGRSSTGSGFVVSPDRIVTNAHVVAGVDAPVVELPGVRAREGQVVYFDPIDDLAVIAIDDLGVAALPLSPTLAVGASAAVQGYPLGGPFTTVTAGVLSVGMAPVPDIYDDSAAPRDVYALQAEVRPGNSGGPLVTPDGSVAGVVFARALEDDTRGYAMTMVELTPVAEAAGSLTAPVSTGPCVG